MARAALPAALACLLLSAAASAEPGRDSEADASPRSGRFAYVYVEPNEGGSSGGHAALRFGDEVFHFQHEEPALLRLHRQDWADFLFRYSMLENRALHESEIAVSADTERRLRTAFRQRQMAQDAQLFELDELRRDVALLRAVDSLRRGEQPPSLELDGLGYLEAAGIDASAALAALAACVAERHGSGYLGAEGARLALALRQARPAPEAYADAAIAAGVYPRSSLSFSAQVTDLATTRELLALLEHGGRLRDDALIEDGGAAPLTPSEEAFLLQYRGRLTADLCAVAGGSRADRGRALAVGMVRLSAVEASLTQGRWVVVDVLPKHARPLSLPAGEARQAYLAAAAAEAEEDLVRARADLALAGGSFEAAYVGVERALNAVAAAATARRGGELRALGGSLLPSRPAPAGEPLWPALEPAETEALLARASAAERRLAGAISDLYGYGLLERNCVTEILALTNETMAAAAADSGRSPQQESELRLGGHVAAGRNYIPSLAAGAVDSGYRLVGRRHHPSYRQRRLEEMKRCEPAWRVWLRESNTLTAEAYRAGSADSTFVFFTEAAWPMRPLLGAVNLGVGIGDALVGLVTLPVAGSAPLERGLRGTLFSLPELAFVSLRSGTTAWIEPSERRRWLGAASESGTTPACREPAAESSPG